MQTDRRRATVLQQHGPRRDLASPTVLGFDCGRLRWVTYKEEGDATPNPEVSKAHHELSVKYATEAGVTEKRLADEEKAKAAKRAARKKAEAEKKKKKAAAAN